MFIWVFGIADDFPKHDKNCCCSFAVAAATAVDMYVCLTSELTMRRSSTFREKKRKHSSQNGVSSIAVLGTVIWLVGWLAGSFDVIE